MSIQPAAAPADDEAVGSLSPGAPPGSAVAAGDLGFRERPVKQKVVDVGWQITAAGKDGAQTVAAGQQRSVPSAAQPGADVARRASDARLQYHRLLP